MQMSDHHMLSVTQAQAWDALNDIDLLKSAIPGCEGINRIGDDAYEVLVVAAIGPVRAKFKGKLRLTDLDAPNGYTMHFEGQGGAAGHAKGSAHVTLEAVAARETRLRYSAEASIGGKLAQIGSRLVDSAAQKTAREFFDNFNSALAARYGVATPEVIAPAANVGTWRRLLAWVRQLWAGKHRARADA
jgi:carbon monoxide dehydrogenase subunit G